MGVNCGGVSGGLENEVRKTRRVGGNIGSDDGSAGGAKMGAETKANKIRKRKEGAYGSGFQRSVVGAAGNLTEGGNQFGGAVKERVFKKKVGKEVEATGVEVRSGVNSGRTRHQKFNGIRRAAEGEGDEGGACSSG
jgi:hypothetical protein